VKLGDQKFCCTLFKEAYENDRGQGLRISTLSIPNIGVSVQFEFRSVSSDNESKLLGLNIPVLIAMNQAFKFCPWCGKKVFP
jgi:hypothetical protein